MHCSLDMHSDMPAAALAAQEVLIDIGEEAGVSPTQVPAAMTAAATEALVASAVESTLQSMPQREGSLAEEQQKSLEQPGVCLTGPSAPVLMAWMVAPLCSRDSLRQGLRADVLVQKGPPTLCARRSPPGQHVLALQRFTSVSNPVIAGWRCFGLDAGSMHARAGHGRG